MVTLYYYIYFFNYKKLFLLKKGLKIKRKRNDKSVLK